MRVLLQAIALAAVAMGLLAAPASARQSRGADFPSAWAAQDVCGCMVRFANRYVNRASYRAQVHRKMARRGVGPRKRKRTKRGIYDWQRDHRDVPNWCNRSRFNRKACTAAIVCITAAGTTLANEGTDGRAWRHAATNCAGAAAAVWLSP